MGKIELGLKLIGEGFLDLSAVFGTIESKAASMAAVMPESVPQPAEEPKAEEPKEAPLRKAPAKKDPPKIEEPVEEQIEEPKGKAEEPEAIAEAVNDLDYDAQRKEFCKYLLEVNKKLGRESTCALLSKYGATKQSEVKNEDLLDATVFCKKELAGAK